jgi:hypothetical protein
VEANKWIRLMSRISSSQGQQSKVIMALPVPPLCCTSHLPTQPFLLK